MAKKKSYSRPVSNYNLNKMSDANLLKLYKTEAKKADQRLVRLEKLSQDPKFGNAKEYAYKYAMNAIESYSGEGATRFNRDLNNLYKEGKLDRTALKNKIRDIQYFLYKTKTSTKKGIQETYQKSVDAFNKKYDTHFTWDEFADLMEMKKDIIAASQHGYGLALSSIQFYKDEQKKKDSPEEPEKKIKRTAKDKLKLEIAEQLKASGLDLDNLF